MMMTANAAPAASVAKSSSEASRYGTKLWWNSSEAP
jgi:hypothetical protein